MPSPLPALTHPSAPPHTWRLQLDLLDQNPFQPRSNMDERALAELVDSIREHGLLQPITVRKAGTRYQVIAGHRRLEAFRRLFAEAEARGGDSAERYRTIPGHEKFDVSDEEMALFGLIENLQRDDLSALDAALGLARFQDAHQLSTDAVCKRTGLELDRVKRLLRLSRAPKVIQDACHVGVLVDQVDERGEVKLLPSGNPKHERSRLDLMAALEFAKFHAHVAKAFPKKADERTARAIERALSERWTFRRVQSFCRAALAGEVATATTADPTEAGSVTSPALYVDGSELRIRRGLLAKASPDERGALLGLLKALIGELSA